MLFVSSSFPAQSSLAMSQELVAGACVRSPEPGEQASASDESGTPSPSQHLHPVFSHFKCMNLMAQKWQCRLCGWLTSGGSVRRKLDHTLRTGKGNAKKCPNGKDLSTEQQEVLLDALKVLDSKSAKKRKTRDGQLAAVNAQAAPKRQRKLHFTTNDEIDKLDMEYARMIVMTASKSGFMQSEYTTQFFQVSECLNTSHL